MNNQTKSFIKGSIVDNALSRLLLYYVSSWVFWNAKLILIFIDKTLTVFDKIDLLSYSDINFISPIIVSVVLLFGGGFIEYAYDYIQLLPNIERSKLNKKTHKLMNDEALTHREKIINKKQEAINIKEESKDIKKERLKMEKMAQMEDTLKDKEEYIESLKEYIESLKKNRE